MSRTYNPKICKIHRSYTVEEVADLFGAHKNTVRNWIKNGLPICDDQRPFLILGSLLKEFLQKQRAVNKHKCNASEMFCFKCKMPRTPELSSVEFKTETTTKGCIIARCPICQCKMNKFFQLAKIDEIKSNLAIKLP